MSRPTPDELADEINERLTAPVPASTAAARNVRRAFSKEVRDWSGDDVLAVAFALVDRHRWVAYELVYHHPDALLLLNREAVEQLGSGLDSWGAADAFGRYIAGPAWQRGLVADEVIGAWSVSPDRWWRRASLVSTVPLNLRAAGGTGDPCRTLAVCARLVDDRDDMVVKALSWALRELVAWEAEAVRAFLQDYEGRVAARVRREVTNKLDTGRKHPR